MRMMKQWEKFVQRCGRCPIPENTEGQTGRGSDEDVPAQCRGVGLETFKSPFRPKHLYYSAQSLVFNMDADITVQMKRAETSKLSYESQVSL